MYIYVKPNNRLLLNVYNVSYNHFKYKYPVEMTAPMVGASYFATYGHLCTMGVPEWVRTGRGMILVIDRTTIHGRFANRTWKTY
jgi:hypothetical protein